jgi:hypothetical protein
MKLQKKVFCSRRNRCRIESEMAIDLNSMSVRALLNLYTLVLQELTAREAIRSTNNPVSDYAEYLVVKALGLTRAAKSTKGYDAEDPAGKRYEIKGRRITAHNPSRMLSAIRDCEAGHFDFLGGVLFKEDFSLYRACLVPFSTVLSTAKYRKHVNAHIFELKDTAWKIPGVVDITDKIMHVIEDDQKRFEARADAANAAHLPST